MMGDGVPLIGIDRRPAPLAGDWPCGDGISIFRSRGRTAQLHRQ